MAYIKLDNLLSTSDILLKNNIVSSIKEAESTFKNSSFYAKSKTSNNIELSELCEEINKDITSLSKTISTLSDEFNNYIEDYYNFNQFLTTGRFNEIKSNLLKDGIKSIIPIDNNEINSIKVININLEMDYENDIRNYRNE